MKTFRTDNLALCPFLEIQGLKYISSEPAIGKNDKPVIVFVFEDPRGVGKDLELDFMRSEFKKYRDLTFFFRNEIDKMKRQLQRTTQEEHKNIIESKYLGEA